MKIRRPTTIVVALAVVVSACASTSHRASDLANAALESPKTTTTTKAPPSNRPCLKSLRPPPTLPAADSLPVGSTMWTIRNKGSLLAGVDENTLPLSYRETRTDASKGDVFKGYEIDLLHAASTAIFGEGRSTEALKHIPVITKEKTDVVRDGEVNLTASAVSMTCDRWRDVLFTIPYYRAAQKIMVRKDQTGIPVFADGSRIPPTPGLDETFRGKRVCATAGSTSAGVIGERLPAAIAVPVPTRTDCLVALQEGTVDAILLHDTFLLGFHQQDPNTTILAPELGTQYYGIAVNKAHPDLVRFLNRLILDLRESGQLQHFYEVEFFGLDAPAAMPSLPDPQWLD